MQNRCRKSDAKNINNGVKHGAKIDKKSIQKSMSKIDGFGDPARNVAVAQGELQFV